MSDEKTFFVETIFGHNTRKPLIRISYGRVGAPREIALMSPEDATSVALNLLNASQASLTDAFLVSFLEEHLKLERNQTIQILSEFRGLAHGKGDKTMTESELRAKYTQAVRIIRAERKQREWVFRNEPDKLAVKLVEMDMLLQIIGEMKDALKPHVDSSGEQMALIEPPVKYE